MSEYLDYDGLLRYHELLEKELEAQSETIAAALNDLNKRIIDKDDYESDSRAISMALNELYKKIEDIELSLQLT